MNILLPALSILASLTPLFGLYLVLCALDRLETDALALERSLVRIEVLVQELTRSLERRNG